LNDIIKQTPVGCHMASHMALEMSSVTSGKCIFCMKCKQNNKEETISCVFWWSHMALVMSSVTSGKCVFCM